MIGVPDKRMGEELCAWIRTSSDVAEEDVKKFLKGKVKIIFFHN